MERIENTTTIEEKKNADLAVPTKRKRATITIEEKKIASFTVSTERKRATIITKIRINFEDGKWYTETSHGWSLRVPINALSVGKTVKVKIRNKQHIISIVEVSEF